MGDVFSAIHPGILGSKSIEFIRSDFLPIFLEGLRFLIDIEGDVAGHDDKGLESLFHAAEEATGGAVAAVSNIGKALGINVLARKKEVSTATEVHVLLHFYRDLLLVQRCAVFHKARMNGHVIRQKRDDPGVRQNDSFARRSLPGTALVPEGLSDRR